MVSVPRADVPRTIMARPAFMAATNLFRPQIGTLLTHRDAVVDAWARDHPGVDVYEDRDLEVSGWLTISVDEQLAAVRAALG